MSTPRALLLLMSLMAVESGLSKVCAQQLDPKRAKPWSALGKVWYDKQDWHKAIEAYDEAIQIDPKSYEAFEGRATARLHLREWDKAIKDFNEAILLNPRLTSAFCNRGVAWYSKGEREKAKADYTEAIRLNPKYSPAFHNRGMIWFDQGEIDKAVTDYTEAIRLNPKYEDAFTGRGNSWMMKRDCEKALKDFEEVVALNPKSVTGLYNRAWFRATCPESKFRDGTKAVQDAKSAYELSKGKSPRTLEALAAAHAEAGDFQDAVKWEKKALEDKEFVKEHGDAARERLKLYEAKKAFRDLPK